MNRTIDAAGLARLMQGQTLDIDGVRLILSDIGFTAMRDCIDAAACKAGVCSECGQPLQHDGGDASVGLGETAFCPGCGLDFPAAIPHVLRGKKAPTGDTTDAERLDGELPDTGERLEPFGGVPPARRVEIAAVSVSAHHALKRLAYLERRAAIGERLAQWHLERYGQRSVVLGPTFRKLCEEVGELGESLINGGPMGHTLEEAADVAIVLSHIVRTASGETWDLLDAMAAKVDEIEGRPHE